MNKTKILTVCSAIMAMVGLSQSALAESPLTGNIGITSNYLWRGMTQANDEAAVSGGIDYAHESGFYIGTWVSNLSDGDASATQYEHDIYGGYGFDAGPIGLDVGYIKYIYPVGDVQSDFDELYVNASYQSFGAGLAYTVSKEGSPANESDLYMFVSAEFEVKKGLTLGLLAGDYDFDDPATTDVSHYQVSLSKDDFTFAYDKTNQSGAAGDPRVSVSWSKSFDL